MLMALETLQVVHCGTVTEACFLFKAFYQEQVEVEVLGTTTNVVSAVKAES